MSKISITGLIAEALSADLDPVIAPTEDERKQLRGALANVLCNASNYPKGVGTRVLGMDMSGLIDKATDAVLARRFPVSRTDTGVSDSETGES